MASFIELTPSYADYKENPDDYIYIPQMWWLCNEETRDTEVEGYELTDKGDELATQYAEDYSSGYDLCYGRAKGLAKTYTMQQMWDKLTTDPEYVKEPRHE